MNTAPNPLEAELLTVHAAWAIYDIDERQLWHEYQLDPTPLAGRQYVREERRARDHCEHTVRALRYKHPRERRGP